MAIQDAVSCCRAYPGANGPDIRKRVNSAQDAAESALSVITSLLDGASRLAAGHSTHASTPSNQRVEPSAVERRGTIEAISRRGSRARR